jgi:hypothetical protein
MGFCKTPILSFVTVIQNKGGEMIQQLKADEVGVFVRVQWHQFVPWCHVVMDELQFDFF